MEAVLAVRVKSRVKTFRDAKPYVYSGNVAPGGAEVGSVFPKTFLGL